MLCGVLDVIAGEDRDYTHNSIHSDSTTYSTLITITDTQTTGRRHQNPSYQPTCHSLRLQLERFELVPSP
jgi:hypothetical protein